MKEWHWQQRQHDFRYVSAWVAQTKCVFCTYVVRALLRVSLHAAHALLFIVTPNHDDSRNVRRANGSSQRNAAASRLPPASLFHYERSRSVGRRKRRQPTAAARGWSGPARRPSDPAAGRRRTFSVGVLQGRVAPGLAHQNAGIREKYVTQLLVRWAPAANRGTATDATSIRNERGGICWRMRDFPFYGISYSLKIDIVHEVQTIK